MQQLSATEVIQRVLALNKDDKPFQFTATNLQIIGDWKIADVKWAALLGAGSINKQYRITVNLDETTHSYTYIDQSTSKETTVSVSPDSIGLKQEKSWFIGKKKEVSGEIGLGTLVKWVGKKLSHNYSYKFDTDDIKKPLFDLLSQSGWSQK